MAQKNAIYNTEMSGVDKSAGAQLAKAQGLVFNGKSIVEWGNAEVIQWLGTIGFNDYQGIFEQHQISGKTLAQLNDGLLKEMGMQLVGKRLELLTYVQRAQVVARQQRRNEILWQADQYRIGLCNCFPYGFPCCFEICIGMPDHYKITHSKVQRTIMKKPFGCACCGVEMMNDNIDMSVLRDVDSMGSTSCCGEPPGFVLMTKEDGVIERLQIKSSEGETVSGIITSCMEEATMDKSQT